ncbi:rRNA N6-adenosine-methyltransferase ZCCHC4 [Phymastichus coffea]|uniref:rRNA N6-adenosine-methyltransferase ZCCHC4 n=1 Tax=Phymastichus coffea TaxID=108790 RepID=UPI00273C926C|nr:rRNA N6-adenosine-methyltransferase ZCCHC4 [Phymastichus coffea]XP_058808007.1 rRNA N6-adenosine-methyltransferase ZCCHC4 [Phymastichus coffea]XP_058808008.1 rRNA N6-adenosine-methyltransferase ZCCHC4 [Phymastichus coffea]XP_058808009.1 rRNA N6-adenosine-methyltransferase ZCCHC4 [Phymastichus coffea]
MKEHTPTGSLHCYWSKLINHPQCIHGPSLMFGRETDGNLYKFYACSACRDRKLCSFSLEYGKIQSKQQKQIIIKEKAKALAMYPQQKLFIQYNQLINMSSTNRAYCYTCERLFIITENNKHADHEVIKNLTDYQMTHPSELLKPLEDSKKEAQYLFSKKSVLDIIKILLDLNAENVLCIGTPRIHEYIAHNLQGKMSSLLLDFDGRFHNFFGPLTYCWYNLFNHHFFQKDSEEVFKDFITQNGGKNMYLICDPPFGGRVEPISQTFKTISDLHKKLNKITDSKDELKIMFMFPYFMEAVMKEKSNPSNVCGGLKDLHMTDYKVEYDNHPLFVSKVNNQQQGSQVRIFTNIPLNLVKLPESDGYKYCKRCQRWVSSENKHCKICHSCTSKDGRRYRHCKICQRCVKPTWQHCKKCDRCSLPNHKCGQKPKIGSCFKCNVTGHTQRECSQIKSKKDKAKNFESKKRKNTTTDEILGSNAKQRKLKTAIQIESLTKIYKKNIGYLK